MGCSLRDFNIDGNWERTHILGHRVDMIFATYKRQPTVGVTLYKVDGRFQGAMHCQNFETVKDAVRRDFDPKKLAEEARRNAEAEKETRIRNRMMWMHKEILETLTVAAAALNDENCPTSEDRAAALAKVLALMEKAIT